MTHRPADLEPEVAAMLDTLEAGFPDVTQYPPEELRQIFRSRRGSPTTKPAMTMVRDLDIKGPGGRVPVRVYVPDRAASESLPVVVFAHGGGFVFCDLDSHDELCRSMAAEVGVVVVSVDYRLAPENRAPAAMLDVYAAVQWAAEQIKEYGGDPSRIAVAGDSAGGNLAAAVALRAARSDGPRVAAQILFYPVVDTDFDTPSYREYGVGYYNTTIAMRWYWDQYAPGDRDRDDPDVVPARAENLAGLPAALVVTAELDPLRSEADRYARRMSDAGVPVLTQRFDGLFHGFLTLPSLPQAARARNELWNSMRRVLSECIVQQQTSE